MIYGISGAPIPAGLPFANIITSVCAPWGTPPCFAYAIAWRESIGEYGANAAGVMSDNGDGGHGLFQLTESFPEDWADPAANTRYAVNEFIFPAIHYWHGLQNYTGETLVLLVAATFNEGLGAAEKYHASGDVDAGTSDAYGHGVLANYRKLIVGLSP